MKLLIWKFFLESKISLTGTNVMSGIMKIDYLLQNVNASIRIGTGTHLFNSEEKKIKKK